jgi:hypothetical protein
MSNDVTEDASLRMYAEPMHSEETIELGGELPPARSIKRKILPFPTGDTLEEKEASPNAANNQVANDDVDAKTARHNALVIAAFLLMNCAILTHMLLKVCNFI